MSVNGSTAIDLSEIAATAGACVVPCFDCQNRPARAPPTPKTITIAATTTTRFATLAVPTARVMVERPEASPPPDTGLACAAAADPRPTASANLARAAGIPNTGTSIHCDLDRKYSSSALKAAASTRNATTGFFLDAARSTSLLTCSDAMAAPDNTTTNALASLMARTMASA